MQEHPLCEQGDACPAIRLPLQQCEAMEKACRWPVAPRQSEPCLYGRLLFVHMPAVQARHAAPLLPATPAADLLGLDAADDTRPPLGLPCEPATRRLGSAAPTGCRAQRYVRWKHRCLARSTLALVHGQGLATSS